MAFSYNPFMTGKYISPTSHAESFVFVRHPADFVSGFQDVRLFFGFSFTVVQRKWHKMALQHKMLASGNESPDNKIGFSV